VKEFRIYRPNRQNSGAASKLQCAVKKRTKGESSFEDVMLFWEMAPQIGTDKDGNAQFDWSKPKGSEATKSITMKLGLPDVGELLLVLTGRKEYVGPPKKSGQNTGPGMFHENATGNAVLKFSQFNDGFYVGMSSKRGEEQLKYGHSISAAEAVILEQLLRDFVSRYHEWR
jgi:hypothetical protein